MYSALFKIKVKQVLATPLLLPDTFFLLKEVAMRLRNVTTQPH